MVNAAGLAVLSARPDRVVPVVAAFLFPFGAPAAGPLPNGWELVVLAAGCGLVAYGAVDRAPGPAYLGVANLVAFVVAAGISDEDTLIYWPALLLALGLGTMFAGLRPRAPLPPEPSAYTTGDVPLASRATRTSRCCACAMIRHRHDRRQARPATPSTAPTPAARSATTRSPRSRASCPCASASSACSTTARSPRTRCSPTGRPTGSAPTASSPAWARSAAARSR